MRKGLIDGSVLMGKLDSGAHETVNVVYYFTCSFPEMYALKSLQIIGHRII